MSNAVLQAIGTGAGIVIVATLTYLAAWVKQNTSRLERHEQAIGGLARANGTRVEGQAAGAGAAIPARAAPLWNQLNDPSSTGALPPQGTNDCGEECAAETIFRQHGVEVQADYLRAQLRGRAGTGVTDAEDLVAILARNNVAAVAESVAAGQVARRLQAVVAAGGQAIALGHWVSPNFLHWVLVTVADNEGAGANDPWGGLRRRWGWPDFGAAYAGSLVVILRKPDGA